MVYLDCIDKITTKWVPCQLTNITNYGDEYNVHHGVTEDTEIH